MTTVAATKNHNHVKYVGTRPKNDQDNQFREKLCNLVLGVGCFHEIYAEKLYLVYLAQNENSEAFCGQHAGYVNNPFIFWGFHESPNLVYEAFNADFGPFNLAATHYFCSKVKLWLDTRDYRDHDKCIVIVLDDSDTKKKLNGTLLVAIAAMVLLNMTDQEVIQKLGFFMMHKCIEEPNERLVFREKKKFADVSGNQSALNLTLDDCIKSFYSALQLKFYQYFEFDHAEYLFYETVMSGDLNWIVPGKILAFAGPSDKTAAYAKLHHKQPPEFYYHYFKDHNVSTIVRLNEPEYESSSFQNLGFDHHDLIFPDGYPPTSTIASRFINIVDEAKGAVAVHCYAGIGRTGTLIAAYLMARYDFTPQMAIAWTRICRPGSVIGDQQDWLYTKFDRYSINKSPSKPVKSRKIKQASNATDPPEQAAKTTYAVAEKTYGQAKALLIAKRQREKQERPSTRNSTASIKSSTEGDTSKGAQVKRSDLILDLGKTVPLMLNAEDFKGLKGQNPKFYRVKDGKYEWKVKFPNSGYVALRCTFTKDVRMFNTVPTINFKYEEEDKPEGTSQDTNETKPLPKLKPVVYYHLFVAPNKPWVHLHGRN